MEPELIHDLAAAYALDALDESERRDFEEHLAGCEQCSEELDGLSDAASALAYVAQGPSPSSALRERLLESVHEERAPNVVPMRRRFALPAVATFGVIAAAAAIVLAVWATSLSSSLDQKRAALRIVANPAARHMEVGAGNQLVLAPNGDAALVSTLSRAPQGKTYELWVISDGSARPAGLFSQGRSGAPVLLARRVTRGSQVGLSLEPAGGSRHPTVILSLSQTI